MTKKEKTILRWPWKVGLFFIFILIFWAFHKPLLTALGRYLEMPSSERVSDVAIIEGGHTVSSLKVQAAIQLLKTGQTQHLLLTLNTQNGWVDAFGLVNYTEMVKTEMKKLNIPDSVFSIHNIQARDPFTYNTAKALVPILKKEGYSSITIVHDNFHNRRSYLTYKKVLAKHKIIVYARTITIYVNSNNWYKSGNGLRRVFGEYIKLAFYKVRGYI